MGGKNFFDSMDFLSNQILLPLGGILIAIFVGWVMRRKNVLEELFVQEEGTIIKVWFLLLKYIAPFMVAMVFIFAVFFGVVT